MEKVRVVVDSSEKEFEIKKKSYFLWKLESIKALKNGKFLMSFSRDENTPHLEEIKDLEKTMGDKFVPMFAVVLPAVLAFICVTVCLILFLTNKGKFEAPTMLFFFIPSGLLLLLSVFLLNSRLNQMKNYIDNKDRALEDAYKKVKEILNNGN